MQILLPGETEDGEMMNNDEQPTSELITTITSTVEITTNPISTSTAAEGKATIVADRNHRHNQQPAAGIELTLMTYSSVTSDTCPQCSSSTAKTPFMAFDELADAIVITNSGVNNPSTAAVT